MKQSKFQQDRQAALEEIRQAFLKKMDALAILGGTVGETSKMTLPDYLRTLETFRWPGVVLLVTGELAEGKPLRQVFGRVSARYDSATRPKKPALAGDLAPAATADGRLSAFDDVLKALTIAERDFDETYKPLSKGDVEYWQKRHPLSPEHLRLAHKENQRHYMKQALLEAREVLEDLQNHPPVAAAPKPPTPPSR